MTTRPMLLLDIDGPLNPWAMPPTIARDNGYRPHRINTADGALPIHLHPDHGPALLALTDILDLVWATGWDPADIPALASALDLPTDLPVIPWPDGAMDAREKDSWKTRHIALWAKNRPFAWVDDEINRRDRAYLTATNNIGPHLALRIEPHLGLRTTDFDRVRDWVTSLT